MSLDPGGALSERAGERLPAIPPAGCPRDLRPLGLAAALMVALALYLVAGGLSSEARRLAAILGLTAALWVTEAVPLPVGALIGVVLAVVLGVAPLAAALAPFAHPLIFLFLGSFLIARAMQVHGLDRRVGALLAGSAGLARRPWRALVAVAVVTALASMWLSNTACTAMIYPLALGMLPEALRRTTARGGYPAALMLSLPFAATLGGLGTPVGTPPNLIGVGQLARHGIEVRFGQWMVVGVAAGAAAFVIMLAILRLGVIRGGGWPALVERQAGPAEPFSGGEKATLVAFGAAVLLWIAPGVAGLLLGAKHPLAAALEARLPEGLVGLGCGLALFLLPAEVRPYRPALDWPEAARIDWGTLLLFGGGMSLGEMFFKTGLGDVIGKGAVALTGVSTVAGLSLLVAVLAAALSEVTSNTATATLSVPVAIALADALGVDPAQPALTAAMASSLGFMLPVSTAPNAIVYGTGHVRLGDMMLAGLLVDVAGVFCIWGAVMLLWPLVR